MNVAGGPHSQKAVPTIDGPPLRRSERHSCLDSAEGAFDRHFYSFARKGLTIGLHIGSNTFILVQLARLTPFRVVS